VEIQGVIGDSTPPSDLDAVYRAYFVSLMRVAYLLTGSNSHAEDVVHDVFLRCAPRLSVIEHPAAYLRTAVVNECRRQYSRENRFDRTADADSVEEMPVELMELRDALQRLDGRKRAAVVLRYFVDVPDSEIAAILGCRPATVRTLLHRAINELREVLA
jgi:RNA polymerase sigma factor (sigma-70 family)